LTILLRDGRSEEEGTVKKVVVSFKFELIKIP
jgi:hypothetical protein